MSETHFDLVVIGAGAAGYVAAIRAAQLGMRVACVDKQYLGGTCLNVGCIPSKALLDSSQHFFDAAHELAAHGVHVDNPRFDLAAMQARKDQVVSTLVGGIGGLFKKNHIEYVKGAAHFIDANTVQINGDGAAHRIGADKFLIATGSHPAPLPSVPFDGKRIVSSTEALRFSQTPQQLLVIGAGAIGLELGSVWSRLGAQVRIVEFMDRIVPLMDRQMTTALQRALEKQGMRIDLQTSAKSAKADETGVAVILEQAGKSESIYVDKVLVAVGRRPHTQDLGLEHVGIELDKKGFIPVNEHYQTATQGIYAVGDVIGGLMLAHKAEEEGIAAVELLAAKAGHVNYAAIPNVVYTHPELASVGLTQEEAQSKGLKVTIGQFPFSASGRARAMGQTQGLVKLITDARTDRLLGAHILHNRAADLIAEPTCAMEFAASGEDLARICHAHPTLAEAVKEAALAAEGRAIHI